MSGSSKRRPDGIEVMASYWIPIADDVRMHDGQGVEYVLTQVRLIWRAGKGTRSDDIICNGIPLTKAGTPAKRRSPHTWIGNPPGVKKILRSTLGIDLTRPNLREWELR